MGIVRLTELLRKYFWPVFDSLYTCTRRKSIIYNSNTMVISKKIDLQN